MLICLQMLSTVLLFCSVTELQKPSSPGLEPRTDFCDCFLFSNYLPAQTNNFGLGTILLSCLVPRYRNHLHWNSNPGAILTEVFVIFFSLFQGWNTEIDNNSPLPYPYLLAIHDHFPVSFSTKETNKHVCVAITTVKNYTHWGEGGLWVMTVVSHTYEVQFYGQ
jgi:hypothetical protein